MFFSFIVFILNGLIFLFICIKINRNGQKMDLSKKKHFNKSNNIYFVFLKYLKLKY